MNHLALYYSAAATAGATDFDLPAVADPVIPVQNSHFIMPERAKLLAAYALGASITRARLRAPSLVGIAPPYITPFQRAAAVPTLPAFPRYRDQGPVLQPLDEVAMLVTNNAGANEAEQVAIFLEMPGPTPQHGVTFTVRATGTTTVTANAWSLCPLTFDYTLPGGRYAITGLRFIGANAFVARLVLPGYVYRPGCIGMVAVGNDDFSYFRYANLGSFGEFESTAIPSIEVFAAGAQTAQEVYLDIVKIR